jgi:shikimate dehydrogenase
VRAGLIGPSIQASRTPMMHMREGSAQGLTYSYEVFDLDLIDGGSRILPRLLNRLESEGYAGVNITHPCKQQVMELVSELSPDALEVGAVNTVTFEGGKRVGRNTDWWGFAEAFRRGLPDVALDRVLLLGAGGAGAAVAYALGHLGATEVIVTDIDQAKAADLIDRMNANGPGPRYSLSSDLAGDLTSCNGLVHTTPTGMIKYPGIALDPNLLTGEHWVSEVVYVPLDTQLVREARAKGCKVLDGSGMAVFQAVRAFEMFTGIAADPERMFLHFKEFDRAPAGL